MIEEPQSLIRMNRLVRQGVDARGFEAWWLSIDTDERMSLIETLFYYADQAGVTEVTVSRALEMASLGAKDDGVREALRSAAEDTRLDLTLGSLSEAALHQAFRFAYSLFGVAEGDVFQNESSESCNHWWHRDLLDPRVEADLLDDPDFVSTSMKTDRKFKGKASLPEG